MHMYSLHASVFSNFFTSAAHFLVNKFCYPMTIHIAIDKAYNCQKGKEAYAIMYIVWVVILTVQLSLATSILYYTKSCLYVVALQYVCYCITSLGYEIYINVRLHKSEGLELCMHAVLT